MKCIKQNPSTVCEQVQIQRKRIPPLTRHEMEMDFARKCHRTVASTPSALRHHQASNGSLPIIQVTCPFWRRERAAFQCVSLCGHYASLQADRAKIDFHRTQVALEELHSQCVHTVSQNISFKEIYIIQSTSKHSAPYRFQTEQILV